MHVHKGRLTDGNGLQETVQNDSEDTGETLGFLRNSDLHAELHGESGSQVSDAHGVHNPSVIFNFNSFDRDPGNFTKDTMPWRQRGQDMDPGGPTVVEVTLFVEQRYKAHLVQSS